MLKQSNESIKMAVTQNIAPANEQVPKLTNEIVAINANETETVATPSTPKSVPENGTSLNVSNTQEVVTTTEAEKPAEMVPVLPQTNVVSPPPPVQTTPPKIVSPSGQFVQVKPPTTTSGRVQSPNVKNFFIRKGIEKQAPAITPVVSSPTRTFITTHGASTPPMSLGQLPANKKIIIKSQQILVPANSVKQSTRPVIQVAGQQSSPGSSVSINTNVIESSSSSDLAGILDLPILFADNSDSAAQIEQTTQILNTSGGQTLLVNTPTDRSAQITSPTNIFFSTTDGKLPNRPVVISAAKPMQQTTLATTQTSNKVIFINRSQIKQQIVGSQLPTMPGTQIVTKGLPTLKLVPTSLAAATQSTPIATLQGNQITKLTPGTKIDFSTLKLVNTVKNASPSGSGGIVKPLIINKAGAKNAIVIKSPMGGNVQAHQVLKGNVLNRNITVRKVMNMVPGVKPVTGTSTTIAIPTIGSPPNQTNTVNVSTTSPTAPTTVSPKTTRKTRSSY